MPPARSPARHRETLIAELATCACCGFAARGAILRPARSGRPEPLCQPCAAPDAAGADTGEGWFAVWAPETSQAALAALVRTAYVIQYLHADAAAAASPPDAAEDADPGFESYPPPLAEPSADRLEAGAHRIIGAVTFGRSFARTFVERKLDRRARGRPDAAAEIERRLALGTRYAPGTPSPAEVERWIEGGGTYAGWTIETLTAQLA